MKKDINTIIRESIRKYINEAKKTYSLDDDVAWYIVHLAMYEMSPEEIQEELKKEGITVSLGAIEDLVCDKSVNQSYQNDDEYNRENLQADTGSGRRYYVTSIQNLAYLKIDILNDYFEKNPFVIWAAQPRGKGSDRYYLDSRKPEQVMLRANFDSKHNLQNGSMSIRATVDPKIGDTEENFRNKKNSNIRWSKVQKSKANANRDDAIPFSLDKGPAEILDDVLNGNYYDVIKKGELTPELKTELIKQEFDRLQQQTFGSVPESKNREKSLRLTESQLRNMITKSINTFLNEELGQPVQSDDQELYDETVDINNGKPFNVFLQICDYGLRAMGSEKTITVFANNKDDLKSQLKDIVKKIVQEYGNDKTIYATITNENGKSIDTILKK